MTELLLEVKNLQTYFHTDEGVAKAVDDVSFSIERGKTLGLVGESGCGKSVSAMSIMRLITTPGRIVGGQVVMYDKNRQASVLSGLPEAEMRKVRGSRIAMIFQEPMTSLNPVFTVGAQIAEAVMLHQKVDRREAWRRAVQVLDKVRIPEPERRAGEYPHQFSGGMRQRAMIAMALSCNPELLIADEPTTALDVTIQAQILDLLRDLQREIGMSILIITHDLGVIAEMADDVAVMYASKIVEYAPVAELFARPLHPYTHGLFASRPQPGTSRTKKLESIEGMVPSPLHFPAGCKFHPRCPFVQDRCREEEPMLREIVACNGNIASQSAAMSHKEPALREINAGHWARCHFAGEIKYG